MSYWVNFFFGFWFFFGFSFLYFLNQFLSTKFRKLFSSL
jgi:hypothetical protein